MTHVAAAIVVILLVAQAAPVIATVTPRRAVVMAVAAASVIGVIIDSVAIIRQSWSIGLARQTPKHLIYLGEHAWVTPFVWGLDTGLIWTTYRVSFCSWLLVLLAAAGIAPAWSGVIYGLAFAIPLLVTMGFPTSSDRLTGGVSAVPAQLVGIAAMLLFVPVLLLVSRG